MEAPAHILEELRKIRDTFELVFDPQGRLIKPAEFDVYGGRSGEPIYEPRWQLWETTPDGERAQVLTLENPDGSFRQPDERLVKLMREVNPEHWGGDINKMLEHWERNGHVFQEMIQDKDFNDFAGRVARSFVDFNTPKSFGAADITPDGALHR